MIIGKIEKIWTNALGKKTKFSELNHQHLSNIIWFNKVFAGNHESYADILLTQELRERFDDRLLEWKPLPIPSEIEWIHRTTIVDQYGNIFWQGTKIGSLSHIENWQNF